MPKKQYAFRCNAEGLLPLLVEVKPHTCWPLTQVFESNQKFEKGELVVLYSESRHWTPLYIAAMHEGEPTSDMLFLMNPEDSIQDKGLFPSKWLSTFVCRIRLHDWAAAFVEDKVKRSKDLLRPRAKQPKISREYTYKVVCVAYSDLPSSTEILDQKDSKLYYSSVEYDVGDVVVVPEDPTTKKQYHTPHLIVGVVVGKPKPRHAGKHNEEIQDIYAGTRAHNINTKEKEDK